MNKQIRLLLVLSLCTIFCFSSPAFGYHLDEVRDVVDEAGNLVTKATIPLAEGDIYISSDHTEWEALGGTGRKVHVKKKTRH